MAFLRASFLLSLALLLVSFNTGSTTEPQEEKMTWCVAKPSSESGTLMRNLDYACSYVDCSVLNKGNACFEPDTLMSHASIAMNLYYQKKGRNSWNCDFMGREDFTKSGLIVLSNPSYGNCVYEGW